MQSKSDFPKEITRLHREGMNVLFNFDSGSDFKNASQIIPYCHPIPVEYVGVEFAIDADRIDVRVLVKAISRTGVEMEALTGVSVALLTIWDMVKSAEKDAAGQYPVTSITDIRVVEKKKGK